MSSCISLKFCLPVCYGRPLCVSMPNFVPIGRWFADIWPILDFLRWRPSAILDLFYAYLDHPQRPFVSLCHCAKFGWNRCNDFVNMPVLMFLRVMAWKCLFAPFFGCFLRGGGRIRPRRWDSISTNLPKVRHDYLQRFDVYVFSLCVHADTNIWSILLFVVSQGVANIQPQSLHLILVLQHRL